MGLLENRTSYLASKSKTTSTGSISSAGAKAGFVSSYSSGSKTGQSVQSKTTSVTKATNKGYVGSGGAKDRVGIVQQPNPNNVNPLGAIISSRPLTEVDLIGISNLRNQFISSSIANKKEVTYPNLSLGGGYQVQGTGVRVSGGQAQVLDVPINYSTPPPQGGTIVPLPTETPPAGASGGGGAGGLGGLLSNPIAILAGLAILFFASKEGKKK